MPFNRKYIANALGIALFLVAWELAGRYGWLGPSFPSVSEIAGAFDVQRQRELFQRAFAATINAAMIAFVLGALLALSIAMLSALIPALEEGLDTLATVTYAIPIIVFGPLLILFAGAERTPVVLGILSTYFPIYIALSSALRFAPPAHADLSNALGASRYQSFVRLRLPHAIPAFVDGLRLGAPAAVLGVILGEWFGSPRGLGIVIISSLQNYRIPQLWAAALLAVIATSIAYVLLSGVYRLAVRRYSWDTVSE